MVKKSEVIVDFILAEPLRQIRLPLVAIIRVKFNTMV
jgi:hypothetical protein